jgi:hypothetical protein
LDDDARWRAGVGGVVWWSGLAGQSARGRSAWQPQVDGAVKSIPVAVIENLFTAPEDGDGWPQAKLHTQWPGGGHAGDPIFDQFYASQVA